MELELKTWSQKFAQEKAAHDEDLARFGAINNDIIVSKEEANIAALQGGCRSIVCGQVITPVMYRFVVITQYI